MGNPVPDDDVRESKFRSRGANAKTINSEDVEDVYFYSIQTRWILSGMGKELVLLMKTTNHTKTNNHGINVSTKFASSFQIHKSVCTRVNLERSMSSTQSNGS